MISKISKMELKARIYDVLPIEQGVSNSGKEWKKQVVVFQTKEDDTFPKFLAVEFWNDKVAPDFRKGEELEISYEVTSKEWNGRYFTTATVFKVERLDGAVPAQQAPVQQPQPTYQQIPQVQQPVNTPVQQSKEEEDDGLPF